MKKIFLIILILLIFLIYLNKQVEKFDSKNNDVKNKIIYGLSIIDKIFNKHNIYYIIAYGTLLGAVRHWDIIPWDDDGDILILRKDVEKILKLSDEFKKNGLVLRQNWKLLKIYFNDSEYPFIDMFIIDNIDNKVVRCHEPFDKECKYLDKKNKWWWDDNNYSFDFIKNRKRFNFNSITVWGPENPTNVLFYWYGNKCLINCKTHNYDHIKNIYIEQKNIKCVDLPKPQI